MSAGFAAQLMPSASASSSSSALHECRPLPFPDDMSISAPSFPPAELASTLLSAVGLDSSC